MGKHLKFVLLWVTSIKTGARHIMRLNDVLRKVLSSSERIMRLVPVLILETRNQTNYKVFAQVTAAALAQSVERLTAEREVAGSIPGTGPILRVLKITEN